MTENITLSLEINPFAAFYITLAICMAAVFIAINKNIN